MQGAKGGHAYTPIICGARCWFMGVRVCLTVCVCHKQDGRCNERGGVSETKGGLGKHKLKALNVTAHSIALRHRSLLLILFAAFYNINNLENITADCFSAALKGNYVVVGSKQREEKMLR